MNFIGREKQITKRVLLVLYYNSSNGLESGLDCDMLVIAFSLHDILYQKHVLIFAGAY